MPSDDADDEIGELRECVKSFLDAQRRRSEAFDAGNYELSPDEGFICKDCGWHGLSAPARLEAFDPEDEGDSLVECPECESTDISSTPIRVEDYQRFGYEYTALPQDIPPGEDDAYRLETE